MRTKRSTRQLVLHRTSGILPAMPEPSTVQLFDVALRGGSIVALLLLGGLLARDHGRSPAARIGVAFAIGVAAYAVCSAPGVAALRTWWHAPLLALASGNAVVFWLFARALFDDGFAPRDWHAVLWLAFAAAGLVDFFVIGAAAGPITDRLGVALALGRAILAVIAVVQTLATWRADLVEGRRRLRGFMVGAIAVYILANTASELTVARLAAPDFASLANAAGLLLMTLVIGWPLTRVSGDELFGFPSPLPVEQAAAAPPVPGAR